MSLSSTAHQSGHICPAVFGWGTVSLITAAERHRPRYNNRSSHSNMTAVHNPFPFSPEGCMVNSERRMSAYNKLRHVARGAS